MISTYSYHDAERYVNAYQDKGIARAVQLIVSEGHDEAEARSFIAGCHFIDRRHDPEAFPGFRLYGQLALADLKQGADYCPTAYRSMLDAGISDQVARSFLSGIDFLYLRGGCYAMKVDGAVMIEAALYKIHLLLHDIDAAERTMIEAGRDPAEVGGYITSIRQSIIDRLTGQNRLH